MCVKELCISGVIFLIISCNNKGNNTVFDKSAADQVQLNSTIADSIGTPTILEESFVDSINIGRKKSNKVEVMKYRGDSIYVVIRFYAKRADKWIIKNEFQFEKDGLSECDTKISDFNNDGLNDMTYVSAVAPRGANELRSLLVYDKNTDQLIFIKDSDHYPNLQYNELLDCIDSWVFHSGTSTKFLRIEKDSFRLFAAVVTMDDSLTVYTYDKKGVEKTIKTKKIEEMDEFIRYKNFNPLLENTKMD